MATFEERSLDVLELHDALEKLQGVDPELARIVELRFFGGLSLEDAAAVMDVSPRTATRLWASSKAWLFRELAGPGAEGEAGDE